MEILRVKLPLGRRDVWIAPLGDIQWNGDDREIAKEHLEGHIKRAMGLKALFLGMGDYIDFLSPTGRQKVAGANHYDNAIKAIDDKALDLTQGVFDLLRGTKGQWLGMLEGHHFAQLRDGSTTDMRLCEKLKTRHLGSCAIIRLIMQPHPSSSHTLTFDLWAHHGRGSGKAHAPILKLESLATYWDADCFLMGHMTKRAAAPINRCYPVFNRGSDGGQLRHREISLVGTGGWSKGYREGSREGQVPRGGFVEQGAMNPVALGAPLIHLWAKTTKKWGTIMEHEVVA